MEFKEGSVVGIVLNAEWARVAMLELFVPQSRLKGDKVVNDTATTLLLSAHIIDLNGGYGIWVEGRPRPGEEDKAGRRALFIPWHAIISIVAIEKFTPEMWQQRTQTVGFQSVNVVE
jgi:hypothetical protein